MVFRETDCIKPSKWYSKFLLWKTILMVFLISTVENHINGIFNFYCGKPSKWYS